MGGTARPVAGANDDDADEALLTRFVDGDHTAFEQLVRRHRDVVFAICWRYFRNDSDAQDAAQETFIRLFRGAATFGGGARFSTWLYRVATNTCTDLARKRVRRPQSAGVDPTLIGDAVGDDMAAMELQLDLRAAMEQLTPEHREVLVLHSLRGLTYAEIAERTGVPLGTVRSRIHRAHANLARWLEPSEVPVRPSPEHPTS